MTLILSLSLSLLGCADYTTSGATDSMGVGVGGAQDFGKFKEILDAGGLPGPETIDDVGFFAEHVIELPEPVCEDTICLHAQLGHMGNMINGSDCTVLQLGMNTAAGLDWERPPLNLVIAVDTSGSMSGTNMAALKTGLREMTQVLEPEDRVTFIRFSNGAEVIVAGVEGDNSTVLDNAIDSLKSGGGTDIYEGLRLAYSQATVLSDGERHDRVLLVSDGVATEGLTDMDRMHGLAAAYQELGFGLTTIGLGTDFDIELMRGLAEEGGGSFYFLQDPEAVIEVFTEEVASFLVPLAEEVRIELVVGDDYLLRSLYGSPDFQLTDQRGRLEMDLLQIAHRTGADDNEAGRRGGGGALIAEMLPIRDPDAGSVGRLEFSYTDVLSGERVVREQLIESPVAPHSAGVEGWFEGTTVEKGFVMLNIYVGFEMAAERASHGDYDGAWSTLVALEESVATWLAANPDADIEDDLVYVGRFIENLETAQSEMQVIDVQPWPAD